MENQHIDSGANTESGKSATLKCGFYIHLSVYMAVNLLLIIINLSTPGEYLWFVWPLMGWGIGLFFHALKVFIFNGQSSHQDQ